MCKELDYLDLSIPSFISKLWELVNDSKWKNYITWNLDGDCFIIVNKSEFTRHVLPLAYRHQNMSSFVRLLNIYGFYSKSIISSSDKIENYKQSAYYHPCFLRDHPELLVHIVRKNSGSGVVSTSSDLQLLRKDVELLKTINMSIDVQLKDIKSQNLELWNQIALLRVKSERQSEMITRLINFFFSFLNGSFCDLITPDQKKALYNTLITNFKDYILESPTTTNNIFEANNTNMPIVSPPSLFSTNPNQSNLAVGYHINNQSNLNNPFTTTGVNSNLYTSTMTNISGFPLITQPTTNIPIQNNTNSFFLPTLAPSSNLNNASSLLRFENIPTNNIGTNSLVNEQTNFVDDLFKNVNNLNYNSNNCQEDMTGDGFVNFDIDELFPNDNFNSNLIDNSNTEDTNGEPNLPNLCLPKRDSYFKKNN